MSQENSNEYKPGGYHPVKVGDFYKKRYEVRKKLGWGHFSTVWECWESQKLRSVAVKFVKSAEKYQQTARDEIKLLKAVRDADPEDPYSERIVHLLDDFSITGINGRHICMVFEVMQANLLYLIAGYDYKGVELPLMKVIMKQVMQGLAYLHDKCRVIHTDLKPENVLVTVPQYAPYSHGRKRKTKSEDEPLYKKSRDRHSSVLAREPSKSEKVAKALCDIDFRYIDVKIADLGNACWTYEKFTSSIQTRQYRSPEVIIKADYDTSADIWSAACMYGKLHNIRATYKISLVKVLEMEHRWSHDKAREFAIWLLPMLTIDPGSRATAVHCLNHYYLKSDRLDPRL